MTESRIKTASSSSPSSSCLTQPTATATIPPLHWSSSMPHLSQQRHQHIPAQQLCLLHHLVRCRTAPCPPPRAHCWQLRAGVRHTCACRAIAQFIPACAFLRASVASACRFVNEARIFARVEHCDNQRTLTQAKARGRDKTRTHMQTHMHMHAYTQMQTQTQKHTAAAEN